MLMSWKCPKCGIDAAGNERRCEACGFVEFGRLVLEAKNGRTITANIDTDVGRQLLKVVDGEGAQHAAARQFRLVRSAPLHSWTLVGCAGAPNDTQVDGKRVAADPEPLHDGSIVTIGGDKLTLAVKIEF